MQTLAFTNWRAAHPFIEDYIFYPEGKNFRWARLVVPWHECVYDGQGQKIKEIYHRCAFSLDLYTGDLYMDCRRRKIWAKCAALIVGTPLTGYIKTLYHLALPISVPIVIFQTIQQGIQQQHSKKQIAYEVVCNIGRNGADIICTPLYTVTLMIVAIAAVCIGFFVPSYLYHFRLLFGDIEIARNWGENNMTWDTIRCFHPYTNLVNVDRHYSQTKQDTVYDQNDPILKGLNNFVRANVKFRRRGCNLFNDCFMKFDPNKPYISAAYDPAWQIPT